MLDNDSLKVSAVVRDKQHPGEVYFTDEDITLQSLKLNIEVGPDSWLMEHCIREQTALSLVVLVIDLGWFWVGLNDTLLTYARFGYKKHLLRRIWLQFQHGSSHFYTFWLHFCEGHDTMMSLLFSHRSIPVKYRMSTGQVL